LFPFAPFLFAVPCPSSRRVGIGFHELVERFITVDRPTTNTALFSPVFYLVKGRRAGRRAGKQQEIAAKREETKKGWQARERRGCTPGVESGRTLARARARARGSGSGSKSADVAGLFHGLVVQETAKQP